MVVDGLVGNLLSPAASRLGASIGPNVHWWRLEIQETVPMPMMHSCRYQKMMEQGWMQLDGFAPVGHTDLWGPMDIWTSLSHARLKGPEIMTDDS